MTKTHPKVLDLHFLGLFFDSFTGNIILLFLRILVQITTIVQFLEVVF